MALIVEDGTGTLAAESYASVTDADTYLANRGLTLWAALSTAAKEQALRLATDYMLQVYRQRWNGTRVTNVQTLDWPRYLVPKKDSPGSYRALPSYYGYTIVPDEVKAAAAMLAYRSATGTDLAPDVQQPVTSESVGPITVTYAVGARQVVRFQAVDHILAPLLKDNGSGSRAALLRG